MDYSTINLVVNPSLRPHASRMTRQEVEDFLANTTHCSAMVKVTDDLSDIMFTHTTWCPYSLMLRIFKVIVHMHLSVHVCVRVREGECVHVCESVRVREGESERVNE